MYVDQIIRAERSASCSLFALIHDFKDSPVVEILYRSGSIRVKILEFMNLFALSCNWFFKHFPVHTYSTQRWSKGAQISVVGFSLGNYSGEIDSKFCFFFYIFFGRNLGQDIFGIQNPQNLYKK